MKKKTCQVLGKLYEFIITSYQKIVPKFIHMKKKLGKKTCNLFLQQSHWLIISHLHSDDFVDDQTKR
jgi:hypothetical protein